MKYDYIPMGVCPRMLEFELDDNRVHNIRFQGGCNGNLQAVSRLVEGMTVEEIQEKLRGIRCGMKSTSCADQLAQAVAEAARSAQAKSGSDDGR